MDTNTFKLHDRIIYVMEQIWDSNKRLTFYLADVNSTANSFSGSRLNTYTLVPNWYSGCSLGTEKGDEEFMENQSRFLEALKEELLKIKNFDLHDLGEVLIFKHQNSGYCITIHEDDMGFFITECDGCC